MVYLNSIGSTDSCDNGDWPSVTVTVTNWDESRGDEKEILDEPSVSYQQGQTKSTLSEEQRVGQSENEGKLNLSVVDSCNHLQVPGRLPHAITRLKSAKELDAAAAEVELVQLPSPQLLDAGALLQSYGEKDKQVPFSSNLSSCLNLGC